jgi:hypothetical protein
VRAAVLVVLALAPGVGCASRQRPGPPTDAALESARETGRALLRGGTIVVGFAEAVDPAHAPTPANESERIVFRNLYETLVRVDGEGAIRPGLAARWERSRDGLEWTFTLRDNARFWDGTPLEPVDVRLAWMGTERGDRAAKYVPPWTLLDGGAEAATVHEDGRITVRLVAPSDGTPTLFAHTALAVVDRRRGETWPVGTGAFRMPPGPSGDEGDLICLPNEQRARDDAPWVRLVFRVRPGADPRDLHADGVDALFARDRATLAYFTTLSDWTAAALPADRLYVLLVPEPKRAETELWNTVITDEVRAGLARDVVLSDANPAANLPREHPPGDRSGGPVDCAPRLIYREDDEDARRIAERLAFLGSQGCEGPSDPRAIPFRIEFDRVKAIGMQGPFVETLDARVPESLAVIAKHLDVIPLVTTRAHLVSRAGLAGVAIDGDGAVRFDGAGWVADVGPR